MATLSALYCVHNEQDLIKGSIEAILPFVDEVIVVDNGSTDNTKKEIPNSPKIKVFDFPRTEPIDMGAIRNFSVKQSTGDWFIQIDADEYYPASSMEAIRKAIEKPGEAISFRVEYHNLAWRYGYRQMDFGHAPDRIYKREAVDKIEGLLPNDMTHVKPEYYEYRPYLEYDNEHNQSFENPVQPILDVYFYHLARTRGYNFEYNKWFLYNRNLHPDWTEEKVRGITKANQWVLGLYQIEEIQVPGIVPRNIPNPKVSIIIPCFQYAQYVGECIQSCLNQTYKPYEIIVVDDGSHDNSVEVIKKYPVKLIQQKNQGVACARNNGIVNSTGDYFLCLDADDKITPDYLEKTIPKMTRDVQVVYTDMRMFGDTNIPHHPMPDANLGSMREAQCVPSACALVDRHCFELSGGYNPFTVYEDYDFWLNLCVKQRFNFVRVPEPLFEYRKHGKSRIDELDKEQAKGFQELNERYGKVIICP